MKTTTYSGFIKEPLNNAKMQSYKTYLEDLSDFEKLFQQVGEDFHKMIKKCKALAQSKNPKKQLKEWVLDSSVPTLEN
jgi:predicted aminopeptidase